MLKRETRILGLSGMVTERKTIIASVVFRGSFWLDGVATTTLESNERNSNLKLSNFIKNSKQFSQLHAVVISQRLHLGTISIHDLARRVKLPVIATPERHERLCRGDRGAAKFVLRIGGEQVSASAARVDRAHAERLYGIGCSPNRKVPEAIRVADLLVEELARTL